MFINLTDYEAIEYNKQQEERDGFLFEDDIQRTSVEVSIHSIVTLTQQKNYTLVGLINGNTLLAIQTRDQIKNLIKGVEHDRFNETN